MNYDYKKIYKLAAIILCLMSGITLAQATYFYLSSHPDKQLATLALIDAILLLGVGLYIGGKYGS